MKQHPLNAVFSTAAMRRRYEVWFLRLGLSDGSGAWWFRYLLMNLGRPGGGGCPSNPRGLPVQIWATWFPRNAEPQSFIQGYQQDKLQLSNPGVNPFRFKIAGNRIGEDSCAGQLPVDGHTIAWDLCYRSTATFTLSDKGWIGFSRTPHSDAISAFPSSIRSSGITRLCGGLCTARGARTPPPWSPSCTAPAPLPTVCPT